MEVDPVDRRIHHIRLDHPSGERLAVVTTRSVMRAIPRSFRKGEVLVGGRGRRLTIVFSQLRARARRRPTGTRNPPSMTTAGGPDVRAGPVEP